MAKLTLTPISTFSNGSAVQATNENYDRIEAALENTLSRDGSTPNQLTADIDLNGNDIMNVKTIDAQGIVLNGVGLTPATTYVEDADHGDIVVTGGGVNWTIDPSVLTTYGRTLINDASASEARTTLGLGTAAITDADDYATAAQGALADTSLQDTDINVTIQGFDLDLSAIAALVTVADRLPYSTGASTWALTPFTAAGRALVDDADATAQRATLGLVIGTNVQAFDTDLAAIASLVSAADNIPYATGAGTWALTGFTPVARTLVAATTQAAQRTAIGVGTASVFNALQGAATYDPPSLADGAGVSTTITVTGALLGNVALASFTNSTQGITVTANVTAADQVTVRFQNETTGVIDLASGTLRAIVFQ